MNTFQPTFTTIRGNVAYEFSQLRARARRDSFLAKFAGLHTKLITMPVKTKDADLNRKSLGIKDIPVDQILGTLGRNQGFDHKFRPLKKHLRDRWVHAYISEKLDGWEPILVHKIGEAYYVEDGHHRVSVAKAIGMAFIEARVWEYPAIEKETASCQACLCREVRSEKVYASR